jgi:phage-related protein
MKLGLAGLALAGTMAALSSIEGAIAGTFEFIKKTLAPAVKRGMTELKKDFKNLDEGLFGKEGLVSILSEGFSDIYDGVKEGDFTKSVDGLKKILGPGVTKLVSVTGDAVVGVFDAVAKTFGYDGDALEKTQEWFRELPNNIDRYVDEFLTTATNVMNDLKKTYNEEGFFAATKQGATGLFDSTVGLGLNYLKDGAAAIADHYGQDEVAKELSALDFSSDKFFESIKNLAKLIYDPETGNILGMDFPNISNLLPTLREIADSIVASLPKWMRPDTLAEQIAEKQENIQFQKNQIASGDDYDGFLNKRTEIIANEEKELAELQRQYDEQYPMPLDANTMTNNNNRIEKTNVLKSVSQIRTETGAPPVVSIMQGGNDNKQIKYEGDTIMKPYRVGPVEMTSEAVLKFKSE